MKRCLTLLPLLGLFLALLCASDKAAAGMQQALSLCSKSLVPSLFPFFVLSKLLSSLGLGELLGRRLGRVLERLLRFSPAGAEAFVIGLTGGYPLGAVTLAGLRRNGRLSRREAERLLPLCNNSGPAFILGGVGGLLGSPRAGALLYLAHALSALTLAFLLRDKEAPPAPSPAELPPPRPFAEAFPAAVTEAVVSTVQVCAYVCFFSALLALADGFSFLPLLPRQLLCGLLELGSGAAVLRGQSPAPAVMALTGALLFWGGLSVHCQTLAALAGTDIKSARHLWGRALGSGIAAVYSYIFSYRI